MGILVSLDGCRLLLNTRDRRDQPRRVNHGCTGMIAIQSQFSGHQRWVWVWDGSDEAEAACAVGPLPQRAAAHRPFLHAHDQRPHAGGKWGIHVSIRSQQALAVRIAVPSEDTQSPLFCDTAPQRASKERSLRCQECGYMPRKHNVEVGTCV